MQPSSSPALMPAPSPAKFSSLTLATTLWEPDRREKRIERTGIGAIMPVLSILFSRLSGSHNVVASVNEENFAGDGAGIRAGEEEGCIAYLTLLDITTQGRCDSHMFTEAGKSGDTTCCKRVERPGRDSVHADIKFSKFKSEITDAALQGSLGNGHHIVLGHDTLTCHIGHGEDRAATSRLHQRSGTISHGN